jgi:hypothetical protein
LDINQYNETNEIPEFAEVRLSKCQDCDRKFRPEALERHRKICTKVFQEKREIYDIKQARNADINQEIQKLDSNPMLKSKKKKKVSLNSNSINEDNPSSATGRERPLKKVPKWKLQSEQFRRAMGVSKVNDGVTG